MSTEPVIDVQNVTFSYDAVPAVKQVNLQVENSEFLALVGPNAGGKSTLLKLMLGLLEPQHGRIRVLGKKPAKAVTSVGYVAQYPSFPRDFPMTVERCVMLGQLGNGWSLGGFRAKDRVLALSALKEVEADMLANRKIGELSGGQLQRVLLARALISDPDILILDEPTANMDQRLESEIFDLLKQLNERMTVIVVSHDIAFISHYVERVACLSQTLVCHHSDRLDGNLINALYGDEVRAVGHHH